MVLISESCLLWWWFFACNVFDGKDDNENGEDHFFIGLDDGQGKGQMKIIK